MVKKIFLILISLLQINSITLAMIISRLAPQYKRAGASGLSDATSQLLNNLLNGSLNNPSDPQSVVYNPQGINNLSLQNVSQDSTATDNYAQFNKNNASKNTPSQLVVDVDKAFRDADITYQAISNADQSQSIFNPKLSISQNLYGKKPNLSAFSQQQRNYSSFAPKSNDPYDILGVSRHATLEEIKAAHKKLVKQYHPDLNQDNKQEATQALQKINNAFDQLKKANQKYFSNEVVAEDSYKFYQSINDAINRNDKEAIKKFIKDGMDLNKINSDAGITPLVCAISLGRHDIVDILLKLGANPNVKNIHGLGLPLETAIYRQDPFCVAQLIQAGAYKDGADDNLWWTPLYLAIQIDPINNEKYEIIDMLLKSGANPNKKNNSTKESPLEAAISVQDPLCVIRLIQAGADINIKDGNDHSALYHAIRRYNGSEKAQHVISALINAGVRIEESDMETAKFKKLPSDLFESLYIQYKKQLRN